MINRQKSEPKVWHWRIRAKASDNQIVTLGKYDTEDQARADHEKIVREGLYRNVTIEEIKPMAQQ
jgi:hypothetical protein